MKLLDKLIRAWRVKVALKYTPPLMSSAFDIGCDDGFLLKQLAPSVTRKEGVDPRLAADISEDGLTLIKGFFPSVLDSHPTFGPYDAIFALAVFEHFSEADLEASATAISRLLTRQGRLIVTVPHPLVDKILDVLLFLRLIDGQATEEHHGFNPDDLESYLSTALKRVEAKRFQFGLNYVFVFEKK